MAQKTRYPNLHLVGVSDPPQESLYYRKEQWGQPFMGGKMDKPWVEVDVIKAPEGYLVVGICTWCGGRIDRLLDLRLLADVKKPVASAVLMKLEMSRIVDPIREGWAAQHYNCDTAPMRHPVDDTLMPFIGHVVTTAGDSLKFGNSVKAYLNFMTNEGEYFSIPFYEEEGNRDQEIGFKKFFAREYMRVRRLTPRAVVAYSEAWMVRGEPNQNPEEISAGYDSLKEHPKSFEVLVVAAATPTYTYAGMADIIRLKGTPNKGPARLGPLDMHHWGLQSRLLDGALATTELPVPQSSLRWING